MNSGLQLGRRSKRTRQIAWPFLRREQSQDFQPRRSHQILCMDFGKNAWAKSGVIYALCFSEKNSRTDHTGFCPLTLEDWMRKTWCDLSAWLFSEKTAAQITPDGYVCTYVCMYVCMYFKLATVAGFWGCCDLPCGAPCKSLVEIYKAYIRLETYVCMYVCMYICNEKSTEF